MHQSLLIDEILRLILHFSTVYDPDSLLSVARTCRAWKDPALDLVWERLSSLGPLLLLLPGISVSNNEYIYSDHPSGNDLRVFYAYARRVKHISNRQQLTINPSAMARLSVSYYQGPYLPNLETVHISVPRFNLLLMPFNLSPHLIRLDLDLGSQQREVGVDAMLCEYLGHVHSHCRHLRHLSVRGPANKRINQIISSMQNLQSLSLRLGYSLSSETLLAIKTFPFLMDLEIDAGHIELDDTNVSYHNQDYQTFPSLRKLHIRAHSSLIETTMQNIQCNTLQYVHLELDDPSAVDSSWDSIFKILCSRTSDTIQHLAIEHHYDPILEPSVPTSSGTAPNAYQGVIPKPTSIRYETLQILRQLKSLRHFTCDFTLPPIMSDDHVEQVISWWPDLEHLELGSTPQNDELGENSAGEQMDTASLALFAVQCTKETKSSISL